MVPIPLDTGISMIKERTAAISLRPALACPQCQCELTIQGADHACATCGTNYQLVSGVFVNSVPAVTTCPSLISQPSMQHILERASIIGPTQALKEWCQNDSEHLVFRHALDMGRSLFREFVRIRQAPRVLDLGCQFGTLGLSFAHQAEQIYLIDPSMELCQFAQRRAEEAGLPNTAVVATVDWRNLPIKNGSLDLIIVNEIQQWRDARSLIAHLSKLLRAGGVIYLGVHKGANFKSGLPEPGGYVTQVTGSVVNRISPLSKGLRRWLTFSCMREYLRAANVRELDVLYFTPNHRFPDQGCCAHDLNAVQAIFTDDSSRIRNRLRSALFRLGASPLLVDSYGLAAYF